MDKNCSWSFKLHFFLLSDSNQQVKALTQKWYVMTHLCGLPESQVVEIEVGFLQTKMRWWIHWIHIWIFLCIMDECLLMSCILNFIIPLFDSVVLQLLPSEFRFIQLCSTEATLTYNIFLSKQYIMRLLSDFQTSIL